MPPWLLAILLKYALPTVINWLRKEGYLDAVEALLAKGALAIVNDVRNLKIDPSYPNDTPMPIVKTNMVTKDGTPVV